MSNRRARWKPWSSSTSQTVPCLVFQISVSDIIIQFVKSETWGSPDTHLFPPHLPFSINHHTVFTFISRMAFAHTYLFPSRLFPPCPKLPSSPAWTTEIISIWDLCSLWVLSNLLSISSCHSSDHVSPWPRLFQGLSFVLRIRTQIFSRIYKISASQRVRW